MKYRYLGNSGLAVARVCLGTMTFGQQGWGCDKKTSHAILDAYLEQGGNFIDTADMYSGKQSEQIIGEWLQSQNREELVIATKGYFQTGASLNTRGLSRKHLISACEASLSRLDTDYIDLYQIHGPEPQTPQEETLRALDDLVRTGKVRYIGCSNLYAWQIMKAHGISVSQQLEKFVSAQHMYNLIKRAVEIEILPACKEAGMSLICWSPLAGGFLAGKYDQAPQPPEGTRLSMRKQFDVVRYWNERGFAIVRKVVDIAKDHNVSPATVSLAWLLKDARVASVITGARRVEQIVDNCTVGDWQIGDAQWREIDEVAHIDYGYPHEWAGKFYDGWYDQIL
ncbi:MAG: aldo/keto reductase [Chitinivibrionales bacterium]|nr:aldo/keto reductase [Chitinivibrionales bacterium]